MSLGNEPFDGDIGVGGNDLLTSSHPLVHIESDTTNKNSKYSSPSRSSESGSWRLE